MMPLGHIGIPLLLPIVNKDLDLDVRLLVIGAMLPDLIDKPLGHLIFPEDNGRIFAHTLLFSILLLMVGLRFRPFLSISIGTSFHHILDGIFLDPGTSLWPLLGPFGSYDFEVYQWLEAFVEPYVISEEIIGLLMIVILAWNWKLMAPGNFRYFLKTGKHPPLQKDIYKKDME